jgi:aspartate/methionine/tyrosine aminotransferase
MSKAFSLPGLRIGWLVCQKPEIRDKLIRLKDYTTICSSAPSEILSIIALRSSDRILKQNLEIIRSNCQTVTELIRRNPEQISWREPSAGSVGMLTIKSTGPIEQLCDELLDRQGILAIGSHLFSLPDPGIRLGLGRLDFKEVLGRFAEHIGLV